PTGLKRVEITGINGDEIEYEEVLPGRIPIRGAGTAKKAQVQTWGNPAMAELDDYVAGVTPMPEPAQAVDSLSTQTPPPAPEPECDPDTRTPEEQAAWEQEIDQEAAQRARQKAEILQRNGLMEQDGKVVGDPKNPAAALAFSAKLRDAARKADQQADGATPSKAKRLRQNARAGYADAERIESTLARCEKCGAFLDKNSQCNNPQCPTNTGEAEETDEFEAEDEEILEDEAFEEPALAVPHGHDYQITDADELGKGGAKTKARQNIEAIKLIQKLEEEGRMATPEEQAVLVKFVGWGGLPQMFDSRNEWWRPGLSYSGQKPEFYEEYQELKKLLTEEEWRAASRSTVNAHYTSATVVRGMWDALKHMGYDRADGNVLEPAVGSGNFFGVMPEEFQASHKVGVELDAFTARIARHLYQNADVRNMGFEKTNLPNDFFDLAISNVPFGNFPVVDREFQGTRRFLTRSIHNFFFAKALDKVKPGGTVAFISSRYTLDSKDDSIRKYLAEKADLVGAIRLPNTAFKENAGTEVTTDIIFLRKRLPGEEPGDTSWVNTQRVAVGSNDEAPINSYFAQHPEMMLGTLSMEGSMYSGRELTLQGDGRPIGEALKEAITHLPKGALAAAHGRCQACGAFLDQNGQCNNPRCPKTRRVSTGRVLPEEGMTEGQYLERPEGVYRMENGQLVPHEKNGQATADGKEPMEVRRIRGLVALNQAARAVLKLNLEEADEAALETAQATLNAEYDAFVQAHGPVNSKANQRAMAGDPNLPFLMALENDYDAEKNTARKEAIFSKRVISVNKTVEKADTPQDALRVALNETGMVNWARMAELTGLSV
ncbi:MAG TPA: N-6 DNA methylase, partial [Anaerolineales bacterium]|nr:N-6 DNA methylase [Anaerolineales bacterium]